MSGSAASELSDIAELLGHLSPKEAAEVKVLLGASTPPWVPLPGPQTQAYESKADIVYYGGAAGGGKTDLLCGLALTQHRRSIILRREATQLVAILDRFTEILGGRDGYNGKNDIWRLKREGDQPRQIEFGSVKDVGDEVKYMGRPHDFIGFDELAHFTEGQFRFLMGWLRTTVPGQRCRVVAAGNPPTNQDGQWIISFFAPWLDPKHPQPAEPGELRWYAMVDGHEVERADGTPFKHGGEEIRPKSRTFIPSRISDNAFLLATDYKTTLQAMPEPLRSQMLNGDFRAGVEDSQWQVCPTAWVEAAMERWTEQGVRTGVVGAQVGIGPMDSLGVDVARGGRDKTILSRRHGAWFDKLLRYPGAETPDGSIVAGLCVSALRDCAPSHVDVIGVGGSVVDHLRGAGVQVVDVVGSGGVPEGETDKATGRLRFRNMRALLWWRMREALDPRLGLNIALPPDPELKADLCAPTWDLTPQGILIESKEQMATGPRPHKAKPLGRSPDAGDAVVYAMIATPKWAPGAQRDWRAKAKRGSWRAV